jgi:hypothetical protein
VSSSGIREQFGKASAVAKNNMVRPSPVMDHQEPMVTLAQKGCARTLMRELIQRLKLRTGQADLSKAERADLKAAIREARGGRHFPLKAHLTEDQVRAVAKHFNIALNDGTPPVNTLSPSSTAAQYLDGLDLQTELNGVGPAVVRDYSQVIEGVSAKHLFEVLRSQFPTFVDPKMAQFYKPRNGPLQVGDRLYIRLFTPIPADKYLPNDVQTGVEIQDISEENGTFKISAMTLKGHFEAGKIEWCVKDLGNDRAEISVHSDARFGGRLSHLAYPVFARKQQTAFWTAFVKNVVSQSGGQAVGDLQLGYAKHKPSAQA